MTLPTLGAVLLAKEARAFDIKFELYAVPAEGLKTRDRGRGIGVTDRREG